MTLVGAVDIGTNSMRLLITDGVTDVGRWSEVTGLGVGVDSSGRLSTDAIERTLEVLGRYGRLMDRAGAARRGAIATSASRNAANAEEFLEKAQMALGVAPVVISGEEEARLAFAGATTDLDPGGLVVCDIGGGSTELVTAADAVSVEVGSVRLTDRVLVDRPPPEDQIDAAFQETEHMLGTLHIAGSRMAGVAGTWTSLSALAQGSAQDIHHTVLSLQTIEETFERLRGLTVAQTAALPGPDPRRAPVILSGCLVAVVVTRMLGLGEVVMSERDTLDGLASRLLASTLG